jgi:hypothetical protein
MADSASGADPAAAPSASTALAALLIADKYQGTTFQLM